jgi:hypothetical protein
LFDRGYRKGSAADERQVRRQNPPDDWSRSHYPLTRVCASLRQVCAARSSSRRPKR